MQIAEHIEVLERRGPAPADAIADSAPDCMLSGPAAGIYLVLWNRADPAAAAASVTGADAVLQAWRSGMRVTWD